MPTSAPSKSQSAPRRAARGATRAAARALIACLALGASASALAAEPAASATAAGAWPVAGQQGLVRIVIVPAGQPPDRALYARQIEQLCPPDRTCFLNFYANPQNVPVTVPLPEAIAEEATAVFRRSVKQGAELFQWSCRLKLADGECF